MAAPTDLEETREPKKSTCRASCIAAEPRDAWKMRLVKQMRKAVACSMEMEVLVLTKNRSLIGPELKCCHGGGGVRVG